MRGYVRLPKDVFSLSMGAKEIKIYSILSALSYANHGGYVKISVKALSHHTDLSLESVKRALGELTLKGIVARSKTYINGLRHSNRYKVVWQGNISKGYILLDLSLVRRFRGDKLLVYLAISSHANRFGYAYVSERAIALETGLSRNTVRKYTEELSRENALNKYVRFYRKHKLTRARRSFAYLVNDVEDIIVPGINPTPSEDEAFKIEYYVPTDYFIALTALHSERLFPLRVPP